MRSFAAAAQNALPRTDHLIQTERFYFLAYKSWENTS